MTQYEREKICRANVDSFNSSIIKADHDGFRRYAPVADNLFLKEYLKDTLFDFEVENDSVYKLMKDKCGRLYEESLLFHADATNFVRRLYHKIEDAVTLALVNGTNEKADICGEEINLTNKVDGLPLFSSRHPYTKNGKPRLYSNYLYGNITSRTIKGKRAFSYDAFKKNVRNLCDKMKRMPSVIFGNPLGYKADTIMIPCNRLNLRKFAIRLMAEKGFEDFSLIILDWCSEDDRLMIMSSMANRDLMGNHIRIGDFKISETEDEHSHTWHASMPFSIAFGTYKHILLAVDSEDEIEGATKL